MQHLQDIYFKSQMDINIKLAFLFLFSLNLAIGLPSSTLKPLDPTNYLQQFGYLPGSDKETGALRTEEEMQRAIKEFQNFANIQVTGKFDEDTMKMMNKPRCGVQDKLDSYDNSESEFHNNRILNKNKHGRRLKRYVLGPSKWHKKSLTFRILNFTPDLSPSDVRDSILKAFHLWNDLTPLSFHMVESGHADMYILFSTGYHQDGYPFDGPGRVLAHAFFPGEDKGGDIHFDDDEQWTYGSENGVNLFSVAAHELGHSLGLAHSHVHGSVMFPWHQGYQEDIKLHYDDIMAIQELYGSKPKPDVNRNSSNKDVLKTTHHQHHHSHHHYKTETSTVTSHIPRHHPHHHDKHSKSPDPCKTSIDAISIIRGETFIFKDKWFWRLRKNKIIMDSVTEINRFWYGLPKNQSIDAVFERPTDGKVIFFIGQNYWVLYGNSLSENFPKKGKPISDFGLPENLKKIDAAFVWGHNRLVYLISGDMYWRLNNKTLQTDYNYPRDISMWGGVKLPIDAAYTNEQGITYFFHNETLAEFNNARMHIRHQGTKYIGKELFNCEPKALRSHNSLNDYNGVLHVFSALSGNNAASSIHFKFFIYLFFLLLSVVIMLLF